MCGLAALAPHNNQPRVNGTTVRNHPQSLGSLRQPLKHLPGEAHLCLPRTRKSVLGRNPTALALTSHSQVSLPYLYPATLKSSPSHGRKQQTVTVLRG